MQVVRLNMSHGDHKSHKAVVDLVREYNRLNRNCLAIMLDTKGPEVRSGDLTEPIDMKQGVVQPSRAITTHDPVHPHTLHRRSCGQALVWYTRHCSRGRLQHVIGS